MKLLAVSAAVAALITGTILVVGDDAQLARPPGALGGGIELAALRTFEDCAAVEDWFREAAVTGQPGAGGGDVLATTDAVAEAAPAADSAAGGDGAARLSATPTGGASYSGTNVQEVAVDEPDVVKTDGRIIVTTAGGVLRIVDAGTGELLSQLRGEIAEGGAELLLSGDRLLVLARGFRPAPNQGSGGGAPEPMPADGPAGSRVAVDMIMPVGQELTRLSAVDVSDPADPEVLGTAELDGGYVSARLVGETARLVLREHPQVDPAAVDVATVLPAIAVDGAEPEPLVECGAVSHPAQPSGPGITTVVTLDVTGSLEPIDTDTVAADAATIYASTDRLYVGTTAWDGTPGTELHAFDTTAPDATRYVGSATAPGWLLNQFSLSERDGVLRVATTVEDPTAEGGGESMLTTFREVGDGLEQLGQVRGLGPGERIYAVRFLDDVAYVVTFRQTDPLYVLDLADPAAPRVLGELKIPGFSSYLHPIDDGRLVGVGQDADDQGRTRGAQVSLFDVRDATRPERVANLTYPNANSPVEYDHKAFLWWGADGTAVVPIEAYDPREGRQTESGALVIDVDDDRLVERGRVTHASRPGWPHEFAPPVFRSMVIGEQLWTLSEAGLLSSTLDGLADTTWVPFAS